MNGLLTSRFASCKKKRNNKMELYIRHVVAYKKGKRKMKDNFLTPPVGWSYWNSIVNVEDREWNWDSLFVAYENGNIIQFDLGED